MTQVNSIPKGFKLLLLLAALLTAGQASAQTVDDGIRYSWRTPGFTTRSLGMGGVGIAGMADASALVNNPAGLAYYNRSEVAGSFGVLNTNDEGSFYAPGSTSVLDQDYRKMGLDNLSYIAKAPTVRGSLVFGVTYQRTNSFGRELRFTGTNNANSLTDYLMPLPGEFEVDVENNEYDVFISRALSNAAYQTYAIDFDPEAYEAGESVPFIQAVLAGTLDQTGRVTEEGAMHEINFGGAAEVSPRVMVGVSANLVFGKYKFSRMFDEFDINNENDGSGFTTDFNSVTLTESFDAGLVGINVRAGLSTEIQHGLRLGLNLETPTFYSISEDYGTLLETTFDNGDSYAYGNQDSDTDMFGEFDYELRTPWRLGVGLAYNRGNLHAEIDGELVDWTQIEFSADEDQTYFDALNRSYRDEFEPTFNLRAGVEYRLGKLDLRAGLGTLSDGRQDFQSLSLSSIDRKRQFGTFGLGYRMAENLILDLGWMTERFEDQYSPYTEVDDAPVVDEDIVRNRFSAGLRILF